VVFTLHTTTLATLSLRSW